MGAGDGVHTTQKTVRPQQRLMVAVMERWSSKTSEETVLGNYTLEHLLYIY